MDLLGVGKPNQLHIFLPFEIEIDAEILRRPTAYRVASLPNVVFAPESVLHIKLPNIQTKDDYLPIRGQSPIEAGSMTLKKSNKIEESAAYLNENKGAIGAVYIDEPDVYGDVVDLEGRWEKKAYNQGSSGKIIWSNSRLGFVNFVQSAQELQIIENARYSTEQICRLFHYPSLLLTNDAKTLDNYKIAVRQMIIQTVLPLQNRYYAKISGWLLPKFGLDKSYKVLADTQYYTELQADLKEMVQILKDAHWLTINEKRAYMEYKAYKDPAADKILMPSGLSDLSEIGAGLIENEGDY